SAPSSSTVTVHWRTLDATAVAPNDYTAASGQLTFLPGQTTKTVPITVVGDTIDEDDESFVVALSSPTNAIIGGLYGLGAGTIVDDDPLPTIVPYLGVVTEGDSGTVTMQVTVL